MLAPFKAVYHFLMCRFYDIHLAFLVRKYDGSENIPPMMFIRMLRRYMRSEDEVAEVIVAYALHHVFQAFKIPPENSYYATGVFIFLKNPASNTPVTKFAIEVKASRTPRRVIYQHLLDCGELTQIKADAFIKESKRAAFSAWLDEDLFVT